MVFSALPALSAGFSLALASALLTNTSRSGWLFNEVGPHLNNSYNWCS